MLLKKRQGLGPAFYFLKGIGGGVWGEGKGPRPLALFPKFFFAYLRRSANWRTWYMKASSRVRVWLCSWPS